MNEEHEIKITDFANIIIRLLQGVIYDDNKTLWNELLTFQIPVQIYFNKIGIQLILNERDGFAYITQPEEHENNKKIPRLTRKYAVSYEVTILLVILRDFLEEHDAKPTLAQKCFVSEKEIRERVMLFFKDKANKTKFIKKIDATINKAVDYKFLKLLAKNESFDENRYEILRIIKSKISLSKLEEIKSNFKEISNNNSDEHISQR